MKLLTTSLVVACFICGSTLFCKAQEDGPKPQKFLIHVDHVITSQSAQYEEATKGFNDAITENGAKGAFMATFSQSNGDYMFASPIENMATLDTRRFAEVREKMGDEAWDEMYSKFDGTYLEHESYIVNFLSKYSYNSEQMSEGENNYRVWTFLKFEDKNWDQMLDVMTKWKELYENKNVENGYAVYTAGFGYAGPVIVVMDWAKSAEAYYAQESKNREVMGEAAQELWEETSQYIYGQDKIDGWYRPELSFTPPAE